MKRILQAAAAVVAAGALAYAGPAHACGAQQKTTMAKADAQQPEKAQAQKTEAKQQPQKDAKAQQQKKTAGAQAKADAGAVKTEQQQQQ